MILSLMSSCLVYFGLELKIRTWRQSYWRKLVSKKTTLVWNSSVVRYLKLFQNNAVVWIQIWRNALTFFYRIDSWSSRTWSSRDAMFSKVLLFAIKWGKTNQNLDLKWATHSNDIQSRNTQRHKKLWKQNCVWRNNSKLWSRKIRRIARLETTKRNFCLKE